MGRGLLFQRQLPWRGRLSHKPPRWPATYAVLAILSDSYPPLKGRLPTCYSPVRHFTRGRSPFLVRLACVRPAANVRSEPGSNSPVILKSMHSCCSISCFVYSNYFSETRSLLLFAIQFSKTDKPAGPTEKVAPLELTTSPFGTARFVPTAVPFVKLFFASDSDVPSFGFVLVSTV